MKTGIYPDHDEATYHADPALSQSGAKLLLDCPARYRYEMANRTEKDAYDLGHAVHAKVLGVGSPVATYPTEHLTASGNVSTKQATVQWVADQRAAGLIPITPEQAEQVDAMAEAILAHAEARALLERDGQAEVSMWWHEETALGWDTTTVPCRGRIDRLTTHDGEPLAIDLKSTARNTGPIAWRSAVLDHGYDLQAAAYDSGYQKLTGDPLPMTHIAVEKAAPYVVAVYPPMPWDYLARGARRWQQAIDTYAECIATGHWPARPGLQTYPDLPAWAR